MSQSESLNELGAALAIMLHESAGAAMTMPIIKITPQIAAMRIRENKWDQLERAIDDIVLDKDYPLDVPEFLKWLQAAITKRQGMIDDCTQEHANLQQDVNILDVIILCIDRDHEHDGVLTRTDKLKDLKIAIETLKVVP